MGCVTSGKSLIWLSLHLSLINRALAFEREEKSTWEVPGRGGLAEAQGPWGSCILPFAHTASFSAHSPSCLLRASLAGASENFPELGYQPGLLKVTSLPPRAQRGLAKAHHSPQEIITSQPAGWQGAWQEPGISSSPAWTGE